MNGTQRTLALISTLALFASLSLAQEPAKQDKKQAVAPSSAPNPVVGSGTPGQITRWTGVSGSNTFTVGDSNITEDKLGKVGIGTQTPTSPLTVRGVIESTLGGIKFPDGTVQTTSAAGALFGVTHDATLQGNGTTPSPIGVAVPLVLSGSLFSNSTITATNTSIGTGITGTSLNGVGVLGQTNISVGVRGTSTSGEGVLGDSFDNNGVRGQTTNGNGVLGISASQNGVKGMSLFGDGVRGEGGAGGSGTGGSGVSAQGGSGTGTGGDGVVANAGGGTSAPGGVGVRAQGGESTASFGGTGVRARGGDSSSSLGGDGISAVRGLGSNGATNGLAGRFTGDVLVTGNLSATGVKAFKIDHPLDPENKYLNHAAIESSEVLNVYSGNITTDANGSATVGLPDWFEAVNRDFRYQLTVIGTFAQAIVAEKMKGNRFVIKTNASNVEVSWQVTGVRSDAGMLKQPFKIEEEKAERERGFYLTPEVFNQPEEKSIEWARHPEMMLELKQQRLDSEARIKKHQQ